MTCDHCSTKEATLFLTQIIEGNVEKLNLCEACSKVKGVHDPEDFALADLLLGLGAPQEPEKISASLSCPHCGFLQSDFKKQGRLGCSVCYSTFSEGLSVMLQTMHGHVTHTGKVPVKLAAEHQRIFQLEQARKSLEVAIQQEHYEEAALYRDVIQQLENKEEISSLILPEKRLAMIQDLLPFEASEGKTTVKKSS